MAKEQKKSNSIIEKFLTGKGTINGFVTVFEPSKLYDKDYVCNILLSKEEGEKLIAKIKEIRAAQFKTFGKGSKIVDITQCVPFGTTNEEGEFTPDKDGRYILKTKAKSYIKNGKPTNTIQIIDSKCKHISSKVNIGEGSTVKLGLILKGYTNIGKTGVSVILAAVQIFDLVEYSSSGSIESFGFEEEEDGFDFDENEFDGDEKTADNTESESTEEVEEEDF